MFARSLLFVSLFVVAGCSESRGPATLTVQNYTVERVCMHTTGEYTLFIKNGERLDPITIETHQGYRPNANTITLLNDAKPDEPMTLEVHKSEVQVFWGGFCASNEVSKDYIIHLHSGEEINGGRYKYRVGKHTHEAEMVPVE